MPSTYKLPAPISLKVIRIKLRLVCLSVRIITAYAFFMLLTVTIRSLTRLVYWIRAMQQGKQGSLRLPQVIIANPALGDMGQLTIWRLPQGERNLMDAANYVWPQRLTVDYPEDYTLIAMIARLYGYMAPRAIVDELFVKNPDLYQVNWHLTAEWKERQHYEHRDRLRKASSEHGGD